MREIRQEHVVIALGKSLRGDCTDAQVRSQSISVHVPQLR